VFAWVASGELHASALSLLKKHLTPENAVELFEQCRWQTARQVEVLLAARFPRPDVRDLVRRLPAQAGVTLVVGRAQEHETGAQRPAKPRRIEPLSTDRYGVHFTADGEFCQLLERVRGLAGHRSPGGDLLTLLKRGLEAYERELEKERFAVGRKPRRSSTAKAASSAAEPTSPDPISAEPISAELQDPKRQPLTSARVKRTWHCPAAVAREVFLRDGGRCTFLAMDGRRCCARRWLELDHIVPRARGGDDSGSNLRLRCRAHNQHHARQCFGAAHVQTAMQDSRGRRAVECAARDQAYWDRR